ncbi:hypothetical protein [Candidatus Mesenet endosymbiont of Phosphuga atrata]|uniref:hypothetical protein n=1 Tax=Candidatus Mesenet endosymbiont of Phosphuga atrata TaxID=3066221 RepID=UPI0030D2ACEA
MKNNTKRDNPIINMLSKIKSSYLSLIAKIKSFFQKQNSNNKNITTEVEDDQQHNQLKEQSDGSSPAGEKSQINNDAADELKTKLEEQPDSLSLASEEPQVNYGVADKLGAENKIDEDEFFDAPGYDKDLENENTVKIEEDEGYVSSSSQDKNIADQNIIIENDRYYSINDFEKTISLSSYSNDTLALAFGGKISENSKITNAKHSLASLYYNEHTKLIQFIHDAGDAKCVNLFELNLDSSNIYMPSYLKNNQSKSPKEVFGDNQIVILLQKPENVNLPPKSTKNWLAWKAADSMWMKTKNNPIEIKDSFPFDFINFSCSNGVSVSQSINRNSPNAFMLSLIDDISDKQKKIDWSIKDILVRGDCISLTKELVAERVSSHLNNTNVEQTSGNHRSCV